MFEQFTGPARTVVTAARHEAGLRGDRRLGTEHLLLGILTDNPRAADLLGADRDTTRTALDDLDRAALAVVGIDIEGVDRAPVPLSPKRTPFTSGARAVLTRAVGEARTTRSRRISTDHLLIAVLGARRPDPAADLLSHLGIDAAAVTERLRTA